MSNQRVYISRKEFMLSYEHVPHEDSVGVRWPVGDSVIDFIFTDRDDEQAMIDELERVYAKNDVEWLEKLTQLEAE